MAKKKNKQESAKVTLERGRNEMVRVRQRLFHGGLLDGCTDDNSANWNHPQFLEITNYVNSQWVRLRYRRSRIDESFVHYDYMRTEKE